MVRHGENSLSLTHGPVPNFYCERQSGGLCRMHALNAYFGYAKLDRVAFETEIVDYDNICREQTGNVSARDFDITTSDQKSVISHILAKSGVFARIYESTIEDRARAIVKVNEYGVAFVHSPDHVWLIRRLDEQSTTSDKQDVSESWYKTDSLSGVSPFDIGELVRNISLGVIIPTKNLFSEFDDIARELNALVMPDIIDYLIACHKGKKVLGRVETLMGGACTLLQLQNNGRIEYAKLNELFVWYGDFKRMFIGKNCGSLKFILSTVPQIIARIIVIWRCSQKLFGRSITKVDTRGSNA
jgi:hypothetical protein